MNLQENLYTYIKGKRRWVKKVEMFPFVASLGYSPVTGDRDLRFLEEKGLIEKQYYKGNRNQNLVEYRYIKNHDKR